MERCFIKYLSLLLLLVSIDIFACRSFTQHISPADVFRDATLDNSTIILGTVNRITCFGRVIDYDTCPQSLVIKVNKTFKGEGVKNYDIGLGLNGSCDFGNFHPTKSIEVNGSTRKITDYQVGQEYLFVIYQRKTKDKNYYYVRAGEILGANTLPYISQYTAYHTANKKINQDK